jgi:hypothetical protein
VNILIAVVSARGLSDEIKGKVCSLMSCEQPLGGSGRYASNLSEPLRGLYRGPALLRSLGPSAFARSLLSRLKPLAAADWRDSEAHLYKHGVSRIGKSVPSGADQLRPRIRRLVCYGIITVLS